jgi:hypothetical protein
MAGIGKEGIAKGRKNTQQGYQFRGIDDVYNALSGLLAASKLVIIPRVLSRNVTERETKSGGVLFYVTLEVAFDFVSAEDGSIHTSVASGEAMDSGDKATNKAMSAAYKYACMQVFCIPTEGNPDADQETHEVAPRQPEHSPADDIPLDEARAEAVKMIAILNLDVDHKIKALKVLDFHDVINKNQALYEAASKQMTPRQRSDWKEYRKEAAMLEKEDRAVSNVGKRF